MGRPSRGLTGLPPRQVPFAIAGHHPELQLLTAGEAAMVNQALRGYCWTVQEGVVPGPESGGASAPSWSVTTLGPRYGLELPKVAFDGTSRELSLTCSNDMARHLGVYGELRAAGRPIEPRGWK